LLKIHQNKSVGLIYRTAHYYFERFENLFSQIHTLAVMCTLGVTQPCRQVFINLKSVHVYQLKCKQERACKLFSPAACPKPDLRSARKFADFTTVKKILNGTRQCFQLTFVAKLM